MFNLPFRKGVAYSIPRKGTETFDGHKVTPEVVISCLLNSPQGDGNKTNKVSITTFPELVCCLLNSPQGDGNTHNPPLQHKNQMLPTQFPARGRKRSDRTC